MSGIPAGATFVFYNGCRFTPSMLADFMGLDALFYAEFHLHLLPSSAIRFESEQEAIFRARYVPATQVGGRKVYDFRWWNGVLWARISDAGTVAAPNSPQANHVLENTGAGAVDIRDTGSDAGVMTAGTPRANWLRANAHRCNYSPEGYSFGEPWHYKFLGNLWATPAGGGATPFPVPDPVPSPSVPAQIGDDMIVYITAKQGARLGGLYLVQGKKATRLGLANSPIPVGAVVLRDEGQIQNLYSALGKNSGLL